jgi:hypothetical protein
MVLLRVCAPEVKKKFQNCDTKKRCTPEKYFVGGLRNERRLFNAEKTRIAMWRRRPAGVFAACASVAEKLPAKRRRLKKPVYLLETQK